MLPLFKSHYSIGSSLLTPDEIFDIAKEDNRKQVIVVEDSFYGFRSFNTLFEKEHIGFVFGIRLDVKNKLSEVPSKLVFFAKGPKGIFLLKQLYTLANCHDGAVDWEVAVKNGWLNKKHVQVAVPFYDSFVFRNVFHFGTHDFSFGDLDVVYFEEENKHPFDFQIRRALDSLGVNRVKVKSIYYRNREDFKAFQMHKAVCNRSHGRSPTFNRPNVDHLCSSEFCWESYLESC